jgi:hypothetical protein
MRSTSEICLEENKFVSDHACPIVKNRSLGVKEQMNMIEKSCEKRKR